MKEILKYIFNKLKLNCFRPDFTDVDGERELPDINMYLNLFFMFILVCLIVLAGQLYKLNPFNFTLIDITLNEFTICAFWIFLLTFTLINLFRVYIGSSILSLLLIITAITGNIYLFYSAIIFMVFGMFLTFIETIVKIFKKPEDTSSLEISNIPEKQKLFNKKVFLGILLGIILLVAISVWWLK